MSKSRFFQYAVLWHPTEKQEKEGEQTRILVDITTVLAVDANTVMLMAAMAIPPEYKTQLNQVEIALRPF